MKPEQTTQEQIVQFVSHLQLGLEKSQVRSHNELIALRSGLALLSIGVQSLASIAHSLADIAAAADQIVESDDDGEFEN